MSWNAEGRKPETLTFLYYFAHSNCTFVQSTRLCAFFIHLYSLSRFARHVHFMAAENRIVYLGRNRWFLPDRISLADHLHLHKCITSRGPRTRSPAAACGSHWLFVMLCILQRALIQKRELFTIQSKVQWLSLRHRRVVVGTKVKLKPYQPPPSLLKRVDYHITTKPRWRWTALIAVGHCNCGAAIRPFCRRQVERARKKCSDWLCDHSQLAGQSGGIERAEMNSRNSHW